MAIFTTPLSQRLENERAVRGYLGTIRSDGRQAVCLVGRFIFGLGANYERALVRMAELDAKLRAIPKDGANDPA